MRQYEAIELAQRNARATNVTWYVVTDRNDSSGDYDAIAAGGLARQHLVTHSCEPSVDGQAVQTRKESN